MLIMYIRLNGLKSVTTDYKARCLDAEHFIFYIDMNRIYLLS